MAEPVIVPIQLDVTDVDMSNVNFGDVQKEISKAMSGIKKSIQDAFGGIDASAISKPIEQAMTSVKKSVQAAEDAQLRYNLALINAGKSSKAYKSLISAVDSEIKSHTDQIKEYQKWLDNIDGEDPGSARRAATIKKFIAEEQAAVDNLQKRRSSIDPSQFAKSGDKTHIEKLESAYKKVLSAQENVNKQSEKFNQTVKDNRTTDEYNELLKQAEAYKKKLDELDAKSKRMEALGATDKQWEALRYDTEQVSSSLDKVIKKMREAVTTGSALRFGDGPKGDLSRQINRLAMSGGNRTGNIMSRSSKNQSPYTEDYQKSLDELDKLEKKVEAIREKSAKMIELGASKKQFQSLAYDAESLDVKIDEVKNHLMNMVNEGSAFKFGTGDADAEIGKLRDKSNSLQSTLTGVATNAKKAQGGLTALGATHPKLAAILTVASKVGVTLGHVMKVAGQVGKAIVKGFASAVKVIGNVARAVGRVTSAFARVGKGIFGAIKNLTKFGKSGQKTTTDMSTRLKKLNKAILMWGLGFRTAYYAIKRLRNIFIESFKQMGSTYDEVGQPIMRLTEAFNRLKGSLATAFQPLVSVVMPILTQFMNYLSTVLEAIGKFNAALTGQKYIYKAVAKEVESVGDSAKETNKQLGSYDKLEVIQQDTDKSNTGYDYVQEEIEAGSAATSFAEMVKQAWEDADFTGVGQFVSDQLIDNLDRVETEVLPKVISFTNTLVSSLSTFLEGFDSFAVGDKVGSLVNTLVEGLDFVKIGELFANLHNTVWQFLDGLFNGIDWANLGKKFADGLTGIFNKLDLESLVGAISGLVNGIRTALFTMITNVNWAEVATKFGEAVNDLFTRIDFAKIGETISALFSAVITFIGNFFATVDWGEVASQLAAGISSIFSGDSSAFNDAIPNIANGLVTFITTLITEVDWANIADTLFNALQTILEGVGTALANSDNGLLSALGKFILAIKEAFDILKPAIDTLFASLEPVTTVILEALTTLLPPIAEIFTELVMQVTPVLVAIITELVPIITEVVMKILPLFMKIIKSLEPIFTAIIEDVLPVIVHLIDALLPLLEGLITLIGSILGPILEALGPVLKIIFTKIDVIITLLAPLFDIIGTICDLLASILEPILEALTPLLEMIASLVEMLGSRVNITGGQFKVVADIFKIVAGILKGTIVPVIEFVCKVIEVFCNVVKMLGNVFRTVFDAIADFFKGLWEKIKIPINKIIGGFESMVNFVIKGLNWMIGALNKLSFDVPDWVPSIGGKKFGFNIREINEVKIPKLAQGAVIPPNKEFLAMLGDQKHGTNIEAPLDTIKQALAEVMAEFGGAGNQQPIVLQVNGRTLAQVVWDEQAKRYKQLGHA